MKSRFSPAIRVALGAVLVATLIESTGCDFRRSPPYRITLRGGIASNDRFRLTGGNVLAHVGEPGVFFGTVTKPGAPREFTYLILFRHEPRGGLPSHTTDGNVSSEGYAAARTKHSFELYGKSLSASYRLELDPETREVESETLEVGGQAVNPAEGRLFLVDLMADFPSYEQIAVELPTGFAALETTEDVERFARSLVEKLTAEHAEIREFFQ